MTRVGGVGLEPEVGVARWMVCEKLDEDMVSSTYFGRKGKGRRTTMGVRWSTGMLSSGRGIFLRWGAEESGGELGEKA